MNKVKLDLTSMNAAQKAQFAVVVGQALVDHESTFPLQPVSGADLMDFAIALKDNAVQAHATRTTWRELISTQNDMLATLDNYLRQTATYVQTVSHGDAAIIELAGLNVRDPAARIGQLPAPENLLAVAASNPGAATLKWKPVKRAKTYIIQYAAAASLPSAFNHEVPVTRSKHTITGLASATRHWFRVAAIGAAGPSLWTNVVSVVTQ